jgi:tetratricopeptide (TPR) repeat protein
MDHLARAGYLLALAVAPQLVSPDPAPPHAAGVAVLAVLVIAGLSIGAMALARAIGSTTAKLAAGLAWIAIATAVVASVLLAGRDVPLGRGAPYVALPLWSALAVAASSAAGEWLGSSFKHKRIAAAVLVIAAGITQLSNGAPFLKSDEAMWTAAARRDPGHELAVGKLAALHLAGKRAAEARKLAARCLAARPRSCTCLQVAAQAAPRAKALERRERASVFVATCPDSALGRALLAEALAVTGDVDGALKNVDEGLAMGGDPGQLEYARALALSTRGDAAAALAAAERAAAAGASRDAKLLLARLYIDTDRFDEATAALALLARGEPNDPDVGYALALLAERRGDSDAARRGYLNVLRVDPAHADARYQMAMISHRAGLRDEARRHARQFVDAFPSDPRRKQMQPLLETRPE